MHSRKRSRAVLITAVVAMFATAVPSTASAATFGSRTLKKGMTGGDVKTLQRTLTKLGLRTKADGEFGPSTFRNVRKYERNTELRVNGIVTKYDAKRMKDQIAQARTGGAAPVAAEPAPTAEERPSPPASDPTPHGKAVISSDGRTAIAPDDAPPAIKKVIAAANAITDKPYRYGGGHQRWEDSAYDCSGAVSYALHGGDLLDSPLDSSSFMSWGKAGRGEWVTVYANSGHAYVIIAGLRFDTSGAGEDGPRWRKESRSSDGFTARHPSGY